MKIAISKSFGGFHLPKKFCKMYRCDENANVSRTENILIDFIENMPEFAKDLAVVEIPDGATDWMISNYDGMETVYFVVDGKIKCT